MIRDLNDRSVLHVEPWKIAKQLNLQKFGPWLLLTYAGIESMSAPSAYLDIELFFNNTVTYRPFLIVPYALSESRGEDACRARAAEEPRVVVAAVAVVVAGAVPITISVSDRKSAPKHDGVFATLRWLAVLVSLSARSVAPVDGRTLLVFDFVPALRTYLLSNRQSQAQSNRWQGEINPPGLLQP